MNKNNIESIKQSAIDKIQEKEQALNGWTAIGASGINSANGHFSGIKVMAGETATITLVFSDGIKTCNTNGLSIDLVEGDYLPTKNLIEATVTAGKVILIHEQRQ